MFVGVIVYVLIEGYCLAPLKRGHVERIYLLIYSVCARRTYCVRDVIKVLNTLIDIIGDVIWH